MTPTRAGELAYQHLKLPPKTPAPAPRPPPHSREGLTRGTELRPGPGPHRACAGAGGLVSFLKDTPLPRKGGSARSPYRKWPHLAGTSVLPGRARPACFREAAGFRRSGLPCSHSLSMSFSWRSSASFPIPRLSFPCAVNSMVDRACASAGGALGSGRGALRRRLPALYGGAVGAAL